MKKEDFASKRRVKLMSKFILLPLGLGLLVVLAISFSNGKKKPNSESTTELSIVVNYNSYAHSQPNISSMINERNKKKFSLICTNFTINTIYRN